MSVVAKFRCTSKSRTEWSESANTDPVYIVRLVPVYSDSEENKTWSTYTPSGYCEMTITNPAAFDSFEAGAEYFVNFTEAD